MKRSFVFAGWSIVEIWALKYWVEARRKRARGGEAKVWKWGFMSGVSMFGVVS